MTHMQLKLYSRSVSFTRTKMLVDITFYHSFGFGNSLPNQLLLLKLKYN